MDGARIAAKSAYGYAKSAQYVGLPHQLCRPSGTGSPVDPARAMRTILFISSANPIKAAFEKPSGYGKPLRYALVDVRMPVGGVPADALRVGDYITGSTGTYFAVSLTLNEDPQVVECNAVVDVLRSEGNSAPGKQPYGGRRTTTDDLLLTRWPASVLRAGRTVAGRADLPGDVPDGGFEMLMPAVPGVTIRTSDRVTDNQGRAFVVSSVEYTDLGVRAVLVLAAT